jgi:hypothetical protein
LAACESASQKTESWLVDQLQLKCNTAEVSASAIDPTGSDFSSRGISLDLALCHRVVSSAADVFDAFVLEPLTKLARQMDRYRSMAAADAGL